MSNYSWEPSYDFCAGRGTSREELAEALEQVRRKVCACRSFGDMPCDCKYGTKVGESSLSEKTGCPELREIIYKLLYDNIDW